MVPPEEGDSNPIASGPSAEEMERYRKKLAEWRDMGFDVSSLEVLLETDFPQFKQKRFELLRNQILEGRAGPTAMQSKRELAGPSVRQTPGEAVRHSVPTPQPARPSLFSHFTPYHGKGTPADAATPARASTPVTPRSPHAAGHVIPFNPAAEMPLPEHAHSEMRYPSVRRKREKRVRTFSVTAEPGKESVGVIDLGGPPGRKATAPVRRISRPSPAVMEISPEEPEPEDESASEDEARASPEEVEFEKEADVSEEEAVSEQEPSDEESGTEDSSDGEPGPKKAVKKRKMAKQAKRSGSRMWTAVGVAIILILAGLGAWYFLAGPLDSLTARDWHPASAMAGENVSFDARNSSSSGSPIVNYSWDFGDGGRDYLKMVTHHYIEPGTYHVSLTVRNEKGDTATRRSVITITPLVVTVPMVMVGDRGNYAARGSALVSNTDTYLYTLTLPPPWNTVQVSQLEINFTGTQDQWARESVSKEDGFKNTHNALRTDSRENLLFSGSATTTNTGSIPVNGGINYNESSYADPASGGVFELDSHARTTISVSLIEKPMESSDTLRTYPSVAGVTGQFRLEKIYSGHKFDQSDPSTLHGNFTGGGIVYSWNSTGVDNAGGKPSVGIHVTADPAALRSSGISEFYVDMFVSGAASMPTLTHVHVAGMNGDTTYISDHYTEMIGFTPGSTPVDRTQTFNSSPLPAGMYYSPFEDVPAAGTGPTSLKFTPEEAVSEAKVRNPDFASYLASNPQAYAVRGKYFEGPVPETACWNLSFAYPGAGTGRYINVSRDILHQYYVSSAWETPVKVTTRESDMARLLTLASAQAIFQNDSATSTNFFSGGTIQYSSGATLSLEADGSYPAINLASMSASSQTSRYAAILKKGDNTSALSMDTGQMMYFWTHAES
jgi:PKD repeat protein